MDAHYKECALAAIAIRIEAAETKDRHGQEAKEWRKLHREIATTPCDP